MEKVIVTTSWDDGHQLDLKLSHLLKKYHLAGTFYIPQGYPVEPGLTDGQIKKISADFEIGGHGLTNQRLTKISLKEAEKEISQSKKYLENLSVSPIKMFAYPAGLFNQKIKELVKDGGYLGARTTENFQLDQPNDFLSWGVTHQVYPHPFRKRDKNHWHLSRALVQPLKNNFSGIKKFKLSLGAFLSWSKMIKDLFDYVLNHGGIWHLWGHSWEIEKYGMWPELENVFRHVAHRNNVLYLTNSQTLENCE